MNVTQLPHDVQRHIIAYVHHHTIITVLSYVSKFYHEFTNSPSLWIFLCRRDFFVNTNNVMSEGTNWQREYVGMSTSLHDAKNITMHVDPDYATDVELIFTPKGTWSFTNNIQTETDDILTAQTDIPLKPLPLGDFSMAYFEVKLIQGGTGQHIGIGLGRKFYYKLMPGWKKGSMGFHADDGRVFLSMDFGYETTDPWHLLDVCGCGIDFVRNNIFFTRNGIVVASNNFPYVTQGLFATIGSKMKDEKCELNFGNVPFVFDLIKYQAFLQRTSPPPHCSPIVPYSALASIMSDPGIFVSDMYEDEDYDPFPHPDISQSLTFFNMVICLLTTFPDESRSLTDRIQSMKEQIEIDGEPLPPSLDLPTVRRFLATYQERKKLLTLCDFLLQVKMSILVRKFDPYVCDLLKCCQVISDDYPSTHPLLAYTHRYLVKLGIVKPSPAPSSLSHDDWLKIFLTLADIIDSHLMKSKIKKREALKSMKRFDSAYYYYNRLDTDEMYDCSTFINNKKDPNANITSTQNNLINNINNNINAHIQATEIIENNNNNNININNEYELNQDEFMFISYVTVTQQWLLQRLAKVLGDPNIPDEDPQIMDAILEWYFVFRYEMRNEHVEINNLRVSVVGAINVILKEFDICKQMLQQDFL